MLCEGMIASSLQHLPAREVLEFMRTGLLLLCAISDYTKDAILLTIALFILTYSYSQPFRVSAIFNKIDLQSLEDQDSAMSILITGTMLLIFYLTPILNLVLLISLAMIFSDVLLGKLF